MAEEELAPNKHLRSTQPYIQLMCSVYVNGTSKLSSTIVGNSKLKMQCMTSVVQKLKEYMTCQCISSGHVHVTKAHGIYDLSVQ